MPMGGVSCEVDTACLFGSAMVWIRRTLWECRGVPCLVWTIMYLSLGEPWTKNCTLYRQCVCVKLRKLITDDTVKGAPPGATVCLSSQGTLCTYVSPRSVAFVGGRDVT